LNLLLPETFVEVCGCLTPHVSGHDMDAFPEFVLSNNRFPLGHFTPIFHPNVTSHNTRLVFRYIVEYCRTISVKFYFALRCALATNETVDIASVEGYSPIYD
jgi:hypothetical protein